MLYIDAVIDGSGPYLDRFFTYRVPQDLSAVLEPGQYIKVPWGKTERGALVYAWREEPESGLSPEMVKEVIAVCDPRPILGALQWRLVAWLREFYFGTWSEAVRCVVPGPVLQGLRKGSKPRANKSVEREIAAVAPPQLTLAQSEVWERLRNGLENRKTFLLHGVTGSGKTELYLRATEWVLSRGKTVLVLVPEVALTPQTQERYRERFEGQVSILHSGLTDAQRRLQWWRIREGSARVVVGTRSAVFAPLSDCGLVILDEEHDSSYKQGSEIRYHARQVAAWLSREIGLSVLLGSATPSLESYTLARSGRYELLELQERVLGRALPRVTVLKGHGLPHQVLQALAERKRRGEQSVLLLNRRGYSNFLQCNDCGWVPECRYCSIALTYHQKDRSLRCHYCGAQERAPEQCADCRGTRIEYPGRGTERLEQELATRLPDLRLARLDRDTVGGKSSVFEETFEKFRRGEFDCLLGTQMVAKGLDFPAVTLVVVLQADNGLHLPDFRATERTFSLLTQVAGRAGRGESPGEVILVCKKPELEIFQQLTHHRWTEFMEQERATREAWRYPPYSRLVRLLVTDEKEERVEQEAEKIGELLREEAEKVGVEILGPAPCPIERLQGRYRWHILLRGSRVQDLQTVLRKSGSSLSASKARLALDPDPLELL